MQRNILEWQEEKPLNVYTGSKFDTQFKSEKCGRKEHNTIIFKISNMASEVTLLALYVLSVVSLSTAFTLGTNPDPNLLPIIQGLVKKQEVDSLCQLKKRLTTLLHQSPHDSNSAQVEDTIKYVQIQINGFPEKLRDIEICKDTVSLPKDGNEDVWSEISDVHKKLKKINDVSGLANSKRMSIIDTDLDSEAVLMEPSSIGEGPVCDDCLMDYNDEKTKEFKKSFEKGEDGKARATKKITTFFVLAGTGVVTVVVALTLGTFFGVRACVKKVKRRGNDSESESDSSVDSDASTLKMPDRGCQNTTFETLDPNAMDSTSLSIVTPVPNRPDRDKTFLYEVKLWNILSNVGLSSLCRTDGTMFESLSQ